MDPASIMNPRLGLVTIGQTPRPDLEIEFRRHAPGVEILTVGALDDLTPDEIGPLAARLGDYPLLTRLADGGTAVINRATLVPYIERALERLAAAGVRLAVLMCAGDFPDLNSTVPVLIPGRLLPGIVRAITTRGPIGVVTPIEGQVEAARAKWTADGFDVRVTWASPFDQNEIARAAESLADPTLDLIVLDCMGHNPAYRREFAGRCGRPVLLAQSAVARMAAEILDW